jgi:mono/diheme cytochrome c family protein
MLRYSFLAILVMVIVVLALAGFRGTHSAKSPIELFPGLDMGRQPRFNAQQSSDFYADSRADRPPVAGTVPLGYELPGSYLQPAGSNGDLTPSAGFGGGTSYFDTGRITGFYGDGIPLKSSEALLERGRERYNINCSMCHGEAGYGNGIVTQYGLVGPANFQTDTIRKMPDGQIFNTITLGKNNMAGLGHQITVEDRWAIIAYIRALELSQHAPVNLLTDAQRKELMEAKQ